MQALVPQALGSRHFLQLALPGAPLLLPQASDAGLVRLQLLALGLLDLAQSLLLEAPLLAQLAQLPSLLVLLPG